MNYSKLDILTINDNGNDGVSPMYHLVKYAGRYWKFYYPRGSRDEGESLVDTIPTEPREYKRWLDTMRSRFVAWDAVLHKVLRVAPSHLLAAPYGDKPTHGLIEEAFDRHLQGLPTYESSCDGEMHYGVYTIDLDLEVFSFHNEAHYQLNRIPRYHDWALGLHIENDNCFFVVPGRVPVDSLANLILPEPQFSQKRSDYWNYLPIRQVVPKLAARSSLESIRWKLFDLFQQSQQDVLSVSLLSWTAEDLPFREIVYFILCLAVGGDYLEIINICRTQNADWTDLYKVIDADPSEADRELIRSLASGFHLADHPAGSAPHSTKYWYEKALVCLVPRLDQPGVASGAIADAVLYGREDCGRTSFNAVLISIAGVVLVRSFPNGSVDHSPFMPLMNVQGYRAMNATQRYGDQFLRPLQVICRSETDSEICKYHPRVTEKALRKKDISKIVSIPKQRCGGCFYCEEGESRCDESDASSDYQGYRAAEYADKPPEESWEVRDTFSRLVKFFDITMRNTLSPREPGKIPPEILEIILSNVTDMKTYNACAKVSRNFRDICARRPLIMDDLVIFDSPSQQEPDDQESEDSDEPSRDEDENGDQEIHGEDWDHPEISPEDWEAWYQNKLLENIAHRERQWESERTTRLSDEPIMYAVRQSTGRRMKVKIGKGNRRDKRTAYEIIIGCDRHRRSYCLPCPLSITGLDIPNDDIQLDEDQSDSDRIDWFGYQPDEGFGAWENLDKSLPKSDWSIKELDTFWHDLFDGASYAFNSSGGGRLRPLGDGPWSMPANTIHYVTSTDPDRHAEYAQVIYLRFKRSSRYNDHLWEDIIKEAKETLAMGIEVPEQSSSNATPEVAKPSRRFQKLGRANPSVILAVGLAVRVFEWHQALQNSEDDVLWEERPGRVYSLWAENSREIINEVLRDGMKRIRAIGSRFRPGGLS
ncbi:MAG: hypothetical protein Q9180_002731 [Flavoplaca navasiana]